ncbi:MAG: Tex family protein [Lachnospiraceae bacterium]|nr:Tex family protein [Lachnospiraceae bacterium]
MDIEKKIAEELDVEKWRVAAAVKLIDEGNTIPFIARYRKEATGTLNDEQLRNLFERLNYLRGLEEKKEKILASIEEQGKLTPDLKKAIESAETQVALEDLYAPYRPKRRTRAMIAEEKGLTPLALTLLRQKSTKTAEEEARPFVNPEKGVESVQEALKGASDILAEKISDTASIRSWIRDRTIKGGTVVSEAKDDKVTSVYENYYHFEETIRTIKGFRVLALNRGEKEKIITVRISAPNEEILRYLEYRVIKGSHSPFAAFLENVCADAYTRLLYPAISREIRSMLTENAENEAISMFGKNLAQLLMQPPIDGRVVLGWDPAFRTGCKLAVVDETGRVLDTAVIFPTAPTSDTKIRAAKKKLKELIDTYHVSLISVGNGTASRESEQIIAEFIKETGEPVSYVITNEAGASVYSASALATEEFPEFDVGQRSATSIARRVQDPLAELVKIDPKSIGVGQYQHDMNQKKLGEALTGVVEDCVNHVGVDLNTASAPLLTYVAGISSTVAKNIVAYREANGKFTSRRELNKVPKLGPKAYEQCAGFLRIRGGSEPLDATAVHPESYPAAKKLLKSFGMKATDLGTQSAEKAIHVRDTKILAQELEIGEPTLIDIIEELKKPGRDPREDLPRPVLRQDVLAMEDLKEGMILKGTVRNIVDFGAFVDIGVHEDGLVHISQMTKGRFIKSPLEVVHVGDVIDVKVLSVDLKKKRIGLTMIL